MPVTLPANFCIARDVTKPNRSNLATLLYVYLGLIRRELLRVLKKGSNPQEEKSDLHEEKKNPQEEKVNLQEEGLAGGTVS